MDYLFHIIRRFWTTKCKCFFWKNLKKCSPQTNTGKLSRKKRQKSRTLVSRSHLFLLFFTHRHCCPTFRNLVFNSTTYHLGHAGIIKKRNHRISSHEIQPSIYCQNWTSKRPCIFHTLDSPAPASQGWLELSPKTLCYRASSTPFVTHYLGNLALFRFTIYCNYLPDINLWKVWIFFQNFVALQCI